MYRFIETICIEGGEIQNLSRHNARMNATRKCFFGRVPELKLEHSIHVPENDLRRTRCRVTYGAEILNIEYFPYQIRPVKSLRLIKEDNIDYRYKYADRSGLDRLFTQRETADDILIIKKRSPDRYIYCQHRPLGWPTLVHTDTSVTKRDT